MLNDKLAYFATSLWKRVRRVDLVCPNCGSNRFGVEDRKYVVTELRRCEACRLLYRAPSDSAADNEAFYQMNYSQGFTTELPDEAELQRCKANGFKTPYHDYGYYVSILTALGMGPGSKLFDYGCSWGYGSWQLSKAGFDVTSYEISRPRAEFARARLGVRVLEAPPDATSPGAHGGDYDCFFSSHVVEHVPQPGAVIALAKALVKPGGYFVAITPNGSKYFRRAMPNAWHQVWGKVHPNLIDDEFWSRSLCGYPLFLGSSPVDIEAVARFNAAGGDGSVHAALDRGELIAVARL